MAGRTSELFLMTCGSSTSKPSNIQNWHCWTHFQVGSDTQELFTRNGCSFSAGLREWLTSEMTWSPSTLPICLQRLAGQTPRKSGRERRRSRVQLSRSQEGTQWRSLGLSSMRTRTLRWRRAASHQENIATNCDRQTTTMICTRTSESRVKWRRQGGIRSWLSSKAPRKDKASI